MGGGETRPTGPCGAGGVMGRGRAILPQNGEHGTIVGFRGKAEEGARVRVGAEQRRDVGARARVHGHRHGVGHRGTAAAHTWLPRSSCEPAEQINGAAPQKEVVVSPRDKIVTMAEIVTVVVESIQG